ncbi:GmrSD restriction endonuclease domain-containing protein [Anaerobranca gottschalkii]|uniref:GmrSD restriction endonucleases N-terminal domain-containing protein n=1 Tax=Anaerobranca gottschalkii DSM 13577 TaxID=1120990 RepID=A0A1I0B3F3_9FIRM|nr:DUF262 domain-containing protein [Anaerobranca gottschalkii]SET00477.1 Protein of unknown function DUF262 [Anaerobranca gottschalkii DSM 13577]
MSRKYEVNNVSVESILSWIRDGDVAIPEIQRPFVWDSTKVRDLIDSLYKGYPVGYLITWRNPDIRLKDGTKSSGKRILIDGQQRVTAMTAALMGMEVLDENYNKKSIKIAFNPLEERFEVLNTAIEKDPNWIKDISVFIKGEVNELKFVYDFCKEVPDIIDEILFKKIKKLTEIKHRVIGIIELSHSLDIETVTEIFIRINSKGVVLSQADFAMSKIAVNKEFNGYLIRKIIDYFCHMARNSSIVEAIRKNDPEFVQTDYFSKITWIAKEKQDLYVPTYSDVIRVAFTSQFHRGKLSDLVSLLSGRNFKTREYEKEIEEESFKTFEKGVLEFVNETNFKRYIMIVKSTGIIDKTLIRSQNVLNFGYILYLTLKTKGVDSNKIEKLVRKWLVLSLLTGRYSGSSESQFDYDIKKMLEDSFEVFIENEEKGQLSDAFWDNILVSRLDTSVRSSPYFSLFLISQIKSGDRGFLSKEIEVKHLIEERGDIHHIFPKKYLQKYNLGRGQYNQIANYVIMQSEINIKIKDKSPKIYFNLIKEDITNQKFSITGIENLEELKENMKENCIPESIFEMEVGDYEQFLNERRKLMAQKIKKYYFSL